ncbi:hypothetical protein [Catenulispora pinisilvae]|uniref:hypothetical protein n=1 Tax=Catenulispora pinisilvae TaxID=2705253 RepID=UPI001892276A|nr:hypothetical protein [Catenulispora pinisilvae]
MFFPVLVENGAGTPASTHVLLEMDQNGGIADDPRPGLPLYSPPMPCLIRFTDDADNHWELTDEIRLKPIDDRSDW